MVEHLVEALSSPDAVTRQDGRRRLVEIGKSAVPAVVELLKHPQRHTRWEAGKVLQSIADPSAAPALVEALADQDADVRWVTGAALIALGGDGLKPLLLALIDTRHAGRLYAPAHHVVHDLAAGDFGELLCPLLEALGAPEAEMTVPVVAEKVLMRIRSP